jgi:hypothetical protein
MNALTIGTSEIRQLDGLYSLNDLHKASGEEKKHQPALFLRHDQTKALISQIYESVDLKITPIKTLRGAHGGTYACKELAVAYGAWISPEFHLKVLRVFLAAANPPPAPLTAESLKNSRWTLHFDHLGRGSLMPERPIVPEELIEAWFEPNGYTFSSEFLHRLAIGCVNRIGQRLDNLLTERKTGNPVLMFGAPLPPRSES